jgi:radical SAM-linked protein
MNRLRIRFKRGPEVKYISHLDIIRVWVRAFRRAGIELAYSEGFNPHPRISLAAPLATGVTGDAELMDVYISDAVSPHNFTDAVNRQMPTGMQILNTCQVDAGLPALQAQLTAAEYAVEVAAGEGVDCIGQALTAMLASKQFPWQHERDTGIKSYDLRPLIEDLWLESYNNNIAVIGMRLVCDNRGSGRPEQVVKALGLGYPRSVHRTRLILKTS